ncbi:hypothetical protein ACIOEW_36735 [Streptomyces sp. NPDC087901]|uniref:hypothetical protein n=1 Tax=Streptomyces sp. NPDC087901 TaxID=3365818 RepID=UPI003817C69F
MTYVTLAVLDDLDALTAKGTGILAGTVMAFLCALAVVRTWVKTNSVIAAGMAFVGAVALWFAVMNAPAFRDSIGVDIAPTGAAKTAGADRVVVQVVDPEPGDLR